MIPIYNGLNASENYDIECDNDSHIEIISRKISFGWYEGIFNHLGGRKIKVVSSMGEQGCGKSYFLNHVA